MLTGRGPHGRGTEAASGPLPCIPAALPWGHLGFLSSLPPSCRIVALKPLAFPLPAPPLSSALVPSSCSSPATATLHPPGAHLPRLETRVFCACVGASPGDLVRSTHVQVFSPCPRGPRSRAQGQPRCRVSDGRRPPTRASLMLLLVFAACSSW